MGLRRHILRPAIRQFHRLRCYGAPEYRGPDAAQTEAIAARFGSLNIPLEDLRVSPDAFAAFRNRFRFPPDYHGGTASGVYDEKLLEHYLAFELANLGDFSADDIYIDVAACTSPWAKILRTSGIQAWAIDLSVAPAYTDLDYYVQTDATATQFDNDSVRAMSLQCAFEMFCGEDDWRFIDECARILGPGGICIISPLYMHTHFCGYSTPEYFRRGFADKAARQYVKRGYAGVPFSRKYDPDTLLTRILQRTSAAGLGYRLYRLINKGELGSGIYCDFILAITKPQHD